MKMHCNIIQDLIPLVNDGVASEESKQLVIEHCKECKICHELLEEKPIIDVEKLDINWKHKTRKVWIGCMALLILFACSFSTTYHQFQNFLLIPSIGAIGYGLLKQKVYILYILIFISHLLIEVLQRSLGVSVIFYTLIYWVLLSIGVFIYWCYHYAFTGGKGK